MNTPTSDIRSLRWRAGLTITDAAARLDVHRSTYWRWERCGVAPADIIEQMSHWAAPAPDQDTHRYAATPFAQALNTLRIAHGDSVTTFAQRTQTPTRTMQRWLRGAVPRRGRLAQITRTTGGDLKELDAARRASLDPRMTGTPR